MITIIYVTAYLRRQPKIRGKKVPLPSAVDVIFKPTLKTEYVIIVVVLLLYYFYFYYY
jgi:hypothetical protein